MEGTGAGQRRRALVPGHGRGRARRPDPRRGLRPLQLRAATPELAEHFKVVDYDLRGYGQSDRPVQDYDMEVWADDVAGPARRARASTAAHVHGTSMGGMIAIVFAGKYPERTTSVVINCAAAKLGMAGRLSSRTGSTSPAWTPTARAAASSPS